ncbi:hypothetical protein, partial [Streptomyces anulatus]|uniref:hypothetical protein n=1 Tax=Streptomyces anulatus TaxID=1892 RepID=UPI001942F1BE
LLLTLLLLVLRWVLLVLRRRLAALGRLLLVLLLWWLLALGATAQRVLARVEVLDLGLLVAVAGRLELRLPGV